MRQWTRWEPSLALCCRALSPWFRQCGRAGASSRHLPHACSWRRQNKSGATSSRSGWTRGWAHSHCASDGEAHLVYTDMRSTSPSVQPLGGHFYSRCIIGGDGSDPHGGLLIALPPRLRREGRPLSACAVAGPSLLRRREIRPNGPTHPGCHGIARKVLELGLLVL